MLHHILVKWNDQAADKAEMAARAAEAFADATAIPGVTRCDIIPSCSTRANRYDLMIRMEMTPEALELYDVSPMHKAWKENFTKYMEKKAIFDCESFPESFLA